MTSQASDYKGNNFLDLLNNEYLPIKPIYTKSSAWLKLFSTLTCYMQEQQEQSLIMLWQTNITWGFFLKSYLNACEAYTQLSQHTIFFMNTESITIIGT